MAKVHFHLNISQKRYLEYYKGHVNSVVAQSYDGRMIQFPADALRPFLTHDGIHGDFTIEFDQNNKLKSIKRMG
ncbi:MAG: DUF2835 domain-containing protein [Gammaproteobacteria bacterium]|nr:DUF2835 domain-containing protein [Gammaproteobacteria bacterium]MDH5731219.1 DUF2835 domain-containing protein [Gammaproteobacteria bacterium]